eukprot:scaffold107436_cov39-Cyclotella_meneghiniana.AAC.2
MMKMIVVIIQSGHARLTHCNLTERMKVIAVIVVVMALLLNVNDGFVGVSIIIGIGAAVTVGIGVDATFAVVAFALTEAMQARHCG